MIRLYPKIPEKFVSLILPDGFWGVLIPLVRIVKLNFFFFCTIPRGYLFHQSSSLILFLSIAFAYYIINHLVYYYDFEVPVV